MKPYMIHACYGDGTRLCGDTEVFEYVSDEEFRQLPWCKVCQTMNPRLFRPIEPSQQTPQPKMLLTLRSYLT